MTLTQLKDKLYRANIPERWYSIDDGLKVDAHILFKNYSKWEYFYRDERGGRNDFKILYSDEEAFDYLWKQIEQEIKYRKIEPRSEG